MTTAQLMVMMPEKIKNIVLGRANEMLANEKVNAKYQSFSSEQDAEEWLFGAVIATLHGTVN